MSVPDLLPSLYNDIVSSRAFFLPCPPFFIMVPVPGSVSVFSAALVSVPTPIPVNVLVLCSLSRSCPRPRHRSRPRSLLPVPRTWFPPRYKAIAQAPGLANGAIEDLQTLLHVCRGNVAYRMKIPVGKQNEDHCQRCTFSLPSARCRDLSMCISDLCFTRLIESFLRLP